jgi:hypothetical protein
VSLVRYRDPDLIANVRDDRTRLAFCCYIIVDVPLGGRDPTSVRLDDPRSAYSRKNSSPRTLLDAISVRSSAASSLERNAGFRRMRERLFTC